MPVTVSEMYGRRLDGGSAELLYAITGTEDAVEARTELLAASATTYDDLFRVDASVDEIPGVAGGAFLGTVQYAVNETTPPDEGDSVYRFSTGGGQQHISQSLETVNSYVASGTAPDFDGAIGVTPNGVEGVDITVPVFHFSETHYLPSATVDAAYKGTLFALTGRVNDDSFKGLAAGECLFLGADGVQRADGVWEVTFNFAASPNVTGLAVGSITGIAKGGWHYLWVRYEEVEDATAGALVQRPTAVYVERVYDEGDFSLMEIGT